MCTSIRKSLIYIKNANYINKLIDKFDYKTKDTKQKMEQIRTKGNSYISKI